MNLQGYLGSGRILRVIKQNPDQVLMVEMDTDHVVRDIDTIEEYERLCAENVRDLI